MALSFTKAHLCDALFATYRAIVVRLSIKHAQKSYAILSLQVLRDMNSIAAGPLRKSSSNGSGSGSVPGPSCAERISELLTKDFPLKTRESSSKRTKKNRREQEEQHGPILHVCCCTFALFRVSQAEDICVCRSRRVSADHLGSAGMTGHGHVHETCAVEQVSSQDYALSAQGRMS